MIEQMPVEHVDECESVQVVPLSVDHHLQIATGNQAARYRARNSSASADKPGENARFWRVGEYRFQVFRGDRHGFASPAGVIRLSG